MKYALLLVTVLLISCTEKNNSNPTIIKQPLQVQGDANFGVVPFGKVVTKSIVLTNDSSSVLDLSPTITGLQGSEFYPYSLGCNSVSPGKKCLIKVIFDSTKEAGTYTADLVAGSTTVAISAQIEEVVNTTYEFLVNGQIVGSTLLLEPLVGNEIRLLSVKVKNNSSRTGQVSSLTSSNPQIQILNNTCLNIKLKPGQSCTAKMVMKGLNTEDTVFNNFSFDGLNATITAQGMIKVANSNLNPIQASIELGDFYEEGKKKIQLIVLTNLGDGIGTIDNVTLPPEFSMISNNCLSVKPGKTCTVRLLYTEPDREKGSNLVGVSLGDGEIQIEANRVSKPNSLSSILLQVDENILTNECKPVVVSLKDSEGLDFVSSSEQLLTSSVNLFDDVSCNHSSNLIIPSFESEKTLYLKSSSSLFTTLTLSKGDVQVSKEIFFYNQLSLNPVRQGIKLNESLNLTTTGGKPPLTYSIIEGVGSVSSSGLFSSSESGISVIQVVDGLGTLKTSEVLVCGIGYSPNQELFICEPDELFITGNCPQVELDGECSLSYNGGVPPYNWTTNGGEINQSGLFTASCEGEVNAQVSLTDSIGQVATVNISQGCWPLGGDGSLTLAAGSYRLEKTISNNLRVVNTVSSAVVKDNFGSYENSAAVQETCKVDFSTLTLNTGATLSVSPECKWLVLGVKGDVNLQGLILANSLTTAGTWTSKAPNSLGELTGDILTLNINQKSGGNGANGTASSAATTVGAGGVQSCGNGGGGGGGAGVNNLRRFPFGYSGGNQSFTVPERVTQVRYKIWGAGGAGDTSWNTYNNGSGGGGGFVTGVINATPLEVFNIIVGGAGTNAGTSAFGGGGIGALSTGADLAGHRSNGGGLTGIFKGSGSYSQASFLAIAGGGAGASSRDGWSGGGGGNPGGHSNGSYNRGYGATTAGVGCNDGVTGTASRGACGVVMTGGTGGVGHNGGGGGGGGYFGGGGGNGGSGAAGGGGGGGLSLFNTSFATGTYENAAIITPGGTGDSEYGTMGSPGRGGTGGGLGVNGAAVLYVEGSTGENGTAGSCGSPGIGGLGSVNFGGKGGNGGQKGLHGQGIYFKTRGNISGTGSISTSGTNGSSGLAGESGGVNGPHTLGNGGTGGGGAGGSGGKIILFHKGVLGTSSILSNGGVAGGGGVGPQNGENGVVVIQSF